MTTDTTTITREIDREERGRPDVDVTIEVQDSDGEHARLLADYIADGVYDRMDAGFPTLRGHNCDFSE